MTPEQLAKAGTEEAEQTALFAWAALNTNRFPELSTMFAIPNGALRNIITATKLKAQGVKAGVPDILLPVARGIWHGLFIEMKRLADENHAKGSIGRSQPAWHQSLSAQGYGVVIAYGWLEAKGHLETYLLWTT